MKRDSKNNPLVSIIIPAFNAEKYIQSCLNSILCQTYHNIEAIVVNDGSSDRTSSIINEFAKKDSRIIVIEGSHRGTNVTRGLGVKKANGRYYMFVDSDDWIDNVAIERLVDLMESNKCDIIKYNEILEPSGILKYPYIRPGDKNVEVDIDEARHIIASSYMLNGMCYQFYRSELFDGISSFDEDISNCEDYFVNLELYSRATSVLFIGDAFYHYRENHDSTTKNPALERIISNLKEQVYVYSCMLRRIKTWGFSEEEIKRIATLTLDKIRRGIFNLFRTNKMSKAVFIKIMRELTECKDYQYIRECVGSKRTMLSEIKKMPITTRLKHGRILLLLYNCNFVELWYSITPYRIVVSHREKKQHGSISKYMRGRLGNQLFQYATLRKIQEKNGGNDELRLNFSKYVYSLGFADDLKHFKVRPYCEVRKVRLSYIQWIHVILHKIERRFILLASGSAKYRKRRYIFEDWNARRLQKVGIYWKEDGELKIERTKVRSKLAIGHFESSKMFDDIRPKLLEEIQPIIPPLEKNKKLYKIIENEESVCISIRRGDFVENPKFAKNFNVCGKEYFENAVKEIKKYVKNPVFVMFSDDIEWCKKNIVLPGEKVYHEDGTDPVWEKLRLMYSCKHFIISNSTFSWWAQYLSRNENKVVIAPRTWTNFGYNKDIYMKSWILIDNQGGK